MAEDNIRVRLAAGNAPNGLTGAKMAPQPADALPTDTYYGGSKDSGSRRPEGAANPDNSSGLRILRRL